MNYGSETDQGASGSARALVQSTLALPAKPSGKERLVRFLESGVVHYGDFMVDVTKGDPWSVAGDRAQGRFLNGLVFTREWVPWLARGERSSVGDVLAVVRRWFQLHGIRAASSIEMAFHDETTAQRLITLLHLHSSLRELMDNGDRKFVEDLMLQTSDLLATEDFHATGNNHGMFQDIALRNYAILAPVEDPMLTSKLRLSLKRLEEYFTSAFTEEGVHIENSPTYHLMISRTLFEHVRLLTALHPGDLQHSKLASLLTEAGLFATHAILPNGKFWPLSDTRQLALNSPQNSVYDSAEFDFAASAGDRGSEPRDRTLQLPDSGYFFARSAWGTTSATYIAFTAAYNGDYHKHSDDLSIFVWKDGKELITEAGPYGYDYKAPLTKYAYSQYAHNNIVVDGASVPRTDKTRGLVWMDPAERDGRETLVRAGTLRLRDVAHERVLRLPHDFSRLSVQDRLTSLIGHTYSAFWNMAPDLRVVLHGTGFEMYRGSVKVGDAYIRSDVPLTLTTHRGEMNPRPLGWKFPEFGQVQPSTTVQVAFEGRDVEIETDFRFREPFNYTGRAPVSERAGWEVSNTLPRLNYILETPETGSKVLCVVFSDSYPEGDFNLNYRTQLRGVGTNVLYILDDFGRRGSYYWMSRGDTGPFRATQELVLKSMAKLGISTATDVAFVGSGKGGTAALLHGNQLGVGLTYSALPHLNPGSHLANTDPDTLDFMVRGASRGHAASLDALFREQIACGQGATLNKVLIGGHGGQHFGVQESVVPSGSDWVIETVAEMRTTNVARVFGAMLGPAITRFIGQRS